MTLSYLTRTLREASSHAQAETILRLYLSGVVPQHVMARLLCEQDNQPSDLEAKLAAVRTEISHIGVG